MALLIWPPYGLPPPCACTLLLFFPLVHTHLLRAPKSRGKQFYYYMNASSNLTAIFSSRTQPEAFFLEVYFNAHPIASPDTKERPKPTNALVPTVIAYPGGDVHFSVNMSREVC